MHFIPFLLVLLTFVTGGFAQNTPSTTPPTNAPTVTVPDEPPLETLPPEFREIEEEERRHGGDHFTRDLLQMLTTLGIMVALIYYISYLIKKMMNNRQQQINESSGIKILESRSLSQRTVVYLIEIDEKEYVIADSANGVTLLDTPSRTTKV